MMQRFFLALAIVVAVAPAAATAQIVPTIVSDPIMEKFAGQRWYKDLVNDLKFANMADNTYNGLQQAIKQTSYALKNAHNLSDLEVAYRNADVEWRTLQSAVKVEKAMVAGTGHASDDLKTAFPGAKTSDRSSDVAISYQQSMKNTLLSAAKAADVRFSQMDSEETLLAAIRAKVKSAQDSNLGTNQLLQIGLQIASEQLDETRAMERIMLTQFQAQQAYMYAHTTSSGGAATSVAGAAAMEQFFTSKYKK